MGTFFGILAIMLGLVFFGALIGGGKRSNASPIANVIFGVLFITIGIALMG